MVHVNVGTANALCGLINAARENIPMVLAAGRTPWLEEGEHGSRSLNIHWAQEMFDQAGIVREHVKWDYELRDARQLEGVLDRALAIATSDPRGPVYLALPREVLAQDAPPLAAMTTTIVAPAEATPDAATIDEIAAILARAEHPLIITARAGSDPATMPLLASTRHPSCGAGGRVPAAPSVAARRSSDAWRLRGQPVARMPPMRFSCSTAMCRGFPRPRAHEPMRR